MIPSIRTDPKPTLLVVDDDESLRKTLQRVLRRAGFGVATAGSVREALDLLSSRPIALVITDLRLPDGDGLDLLAEIKTRKLDPSAIVISAYGEEGAFDEAEAAGALACLPKPVEREAIVGAVTKALEIGHPEHVSPRTT